MDVVNNSENIEKLEKKSKLLSPTTYSIAFFFLKNSVWL